MDRYLDDLAVGGFENFVKIMKKVFTIASEKVKSAAQIDNSSAPRHF